MVLRFLFMISFVLMVTGCPRSNEAHTPIAPASTYHGIQQARPVSTTFTRVSIKGQLNVNLHTGYRQPRVILRGDPRDLSFVTTSVANGVLQVTIPPEHPQFGGVDVEIDARYLNSFEYHGAGYVTGSQLRTGLLDVVVENPGRTQLQGQIGLRRLEVKGGGDTQISGINSPSMSVDISGKSTVRLAGVVNITSINMVKEGRLSLYWVKSRELIVRGRGKSFVQLAGAVDRLDVELWGQARFNGRYLRAFTAFVKTHNQSVAELSAVKHQHTLADDKSDIHFYNIPSMKADFMAYNGAVLDMRELGVPFIQEYDQYNK